MTTVTSTIFPYLNADIDAAVIRHCDTPSLIQLSGTNKQAAFVVLTNDSFFKDRFYSQHPTLEKYNHFADWIEKRPTNCWKWTCLFMDPHCQIPVQCSSLFANPKPKEEWYLRTDIINSLQTEHVNETVPRLQQASELITEMLNCPKKKCKETWLQVWDLINACDYPNKYKKELFNGIGHIVLGSSIWQKLHSQCAKGAKETGWAEKHFQDFLPELRNILAAGIQSQTSVFIMSQANLKKA